MENQLEEHVSYSGDSLFNSHQPVLMGHCSMRSTLPNLQLDGGDKNFADGLASPNNTQSVSNIALLTEPYPLTLPEIESTFSLVSSSNQEVQSYDPLPYHHYPRSTPVGNIEPSPNFDEANHGQFPPAQVSNSCCFDRHSSEVYSSELHREPLLPASSKAGSDLPFPSPPPYNWQQSHQFAMNCNNNNINENTQQTDLQNPIYFVQDKQGRLESSSNEVVSSVSNPVNSRFLIPLQRRSLLNGAGARPGELKGSKYSPDGKKRGVTKKRKKRGTNEPQKPVSAYALFFRDTQASIKSDNPSATFGEISKVVASMWDGLTEGAKQVYKQKTETAKRDYLKQLAAYRANLVSKGGLDMEDDKGTDPRQSSHSAFYPSPTQPTLPNFAIRETPTQPAHFNPASQQSVHHNPAPQQLPTGPTDVTTNEGSVFRGIPPTHFLIQSSSRSTMFNDCAN